MKTKILIQLIILLITIVICVILGLCACWKAMFYILLVLGILEIMRGGIVQLLRRKNMLKFIPIYILGGLYLLAALIVSLSTHCLMD